MSKHFIGARANCMDWLDGQDFYELCQQYRHAQEWTQPTVVEAFWSLKNYILTRLEKELDDASETAAIHEQNNHGKYDE